MKPIKIHSNETPSQSVGFRNHILPFTIGLKIMTNFKIYLLAFFLLTGFEALCVARLWNGGASTLNWGDAANWNPSGVPTSADAITIATGVSVVVNVTNAQCASLALVPSSGSNVISAISFFDATSKLTVSGTITLGSGSGSNRKGNISMANGGTLICQGLIITLSDSWLPGTGTVEFTANTTTLTATFNSFNNLTISGGTTTLGTATTISGLLSLTGGTLNMANFALSAGSLTGTSNITNSSGTAANVTITVGSNNASPAAYSGVISNGNATSVALTKLGTGTLTLSGANTYTGATNITVGVLNIQNASATGTTAGGVVVSSGAALQIQGGITVGSEALSIAGTGISTTGALRNISGANTWGGVITQAAVSKISSDAGTLTLNAATNAITGTFNLTFDGAGAITVSTPIATSTGTLTKAGAGTLTLSAANTYTGLTTISAGSLTYGVSNAISTGAITVDGATAILNLLTFTESAGTITLDNGGSITSSTGTLTTTGTFEMKSGTVSAILAGAVALNKTTSGSVTLSGANTYTGGTNLSVGVLNINNTSALGTSGTFTITGGSIDNTSAGDITTNNYTLVLNGDFTYIGSAARILNLGTGAVTMSADRQITASAGTLTIGGILNNNARSLTKAGAGILSFGIQAVTLNNITISAGTLVSTSTTLNIAGDFINSGTFTHNSGTVNFNKSGAQNIGVGPFNNLTCSNTGAKVATGNVTVGGVFTLSGTTTFTLGANTLTINGTISGMDASHYLTANGSSSNIIIGGSGALGVLYFDQTGAGTSNRINNLTYNRISTGTFSLGNSVEVVGTITPTAGVLTTADNLKLVSNASGTARVAAGSSGYISGNVTVERFIPSWARRWRFGGSPVSGRTMFDLKDDIFITGNDPSFDATSSNQPSIYRYNEAITTGDLNSGWEAIANTAESIVVGKGYRIFIRGDRSDNGRLNGTVTTQNEVTLDLTGTLNMGDIVMPVTFSSSGIPANDGWNLVANPYASPISWNAVRDPGTNSTNIGQIAYIFDATTNSYTSYNALSDMGSGNLFTSRGIIPAGSAFWVQATAASPALTIKEAHKTDSISAAVFKTSNEQFTVKLIQDSITSDEAAFKYIPGTSAGLDGYDIPKMYGADVNIASIGTDGSFLSANCKPFNGTSDTIPLSLGFANSGDYTMEFKNAAGLGLAAGKTIYLVDLFKQQRVDVNTTATYAFTVDKNAAATFGNARFMLVVGDITTAAPEFAATAETKKMYVYPSKTSDRVTVYSNQTMGEQSTVTITDITGKTIATLNNPNWDNNNLVLDLSSYRSGVYFISIGNGQSTQTLKCIKE